MFALAAVAAVIVVVVIAASTGGGSPRTTFTVPLSNSDLAMRLPAAWTERRPALFGEHAVAGGRGEAFVAAALVAGTTDPTLIPSSLLSTLERPLPKPGRISIDGQDAYRYDGLRRRGSSVPLRVYSQLTKQGVAAIACAAPVGSAAFDDCDGIAQTLKLTSADKLPIGPTKRYDARLKASFASLNAAVGAVKRDGSSPDAKAAAARQLARAYAAASASLRDGAGASRLNPVDAGLNDRLTRWFDETASAYRQIDGAERLDDAGAKADAQHALGAAQKQTREHVAALTRAGYTFGIGSASPR